MTPYAFCEKHGITADVDGGDYRRDDDGWEHVAYVVTLTNARGETLTIPFRCGMALDAPTAADVIGSLAMDQSIDTSTFDDFAADYGYDTDSRKAYAAWESVRQQQRDVSAWLTVAEMGALGRVDA